MYEIPYVDLNNLNLDWVLKNMKRLVSEWAAYQVSMGNKFDSLAAAYEALQEDYHSWFGNLNVQNEINNKLDSMVSSGEFLNIVRPTLISETDTWLAAHITNPNSPPLDRTLTSSAAAAPADMLGTTTLKSLNYKRSLAEGDDLDSLYEPGWYIIGNSISIVNAPEETKGYRYILIYTGASIAATQFKHMVYINARYGRIYTRVMHDYSWGSWINPIQGQLDTALTSTTQPAQGKAVGDLIRELQDDTFVNRGAVPDNSDLNDITIEPGWRSISTSSSNIANLPDGSTSGYRYVLMFNGYGSSAATFTHMVFVNENTGYAAVRKFSENTWSNWVILGQAGIIELMENSSRFVRRATITAGTDLNDITDCGWYIVQQAAGILNSPENKTGYRMIFVYQGAGAGFLNQLYVNRNTGFLAMRTRTGGEGWLAVGWTIISPGFQGIRALGVTPMRNMPMFDISHRGYMDEAPENSALGYRLAAKYGYYGVETDIQFTSDNVPVMLHDRNIVNTARNPDGTTISGGPIYIDQITYAQANEYDWGYKAGAQFAGTQLLQLSEALEVISRCNLKICMLHFKETVTTAARRSIIYQTVYEKGMKNNVILMSGSKTTLTHIAEEVENMRICLSNDPNYCNDQLVPYLQSIQLNGNEVWLTSNNLLYPDLIAYVDDAVEAGFITTARADDATWIQNYTRPWARVFITNAKDKFKPSEYLYNQQMALIPT